MSRALGIKTRRAANEPSFEWSRDLLEGAPGPDQEIHVGGCPLPPHSSAISKLIKRAQSVTRPSFQPQTAFSGEPD
jgi:hypothetical protein